jgi:diguanylate cyclase (GGDEF)-like protein
VDTKQDTPRDPPGSVFDGDVTQISRSGAVESEVRRVATLVVVQGAQIGRHYPLRRNRVVLGRSEAADIVLPDKEVSRAHAAIEAVRLGSETLFRLVDLGSTNRVFVNGRPSEAHILAEGDKLQLGGQVLKFELHDAIDSQFHTEIRNRIHYDDLTGLLTYESFRAALTWEIERYANSARGCAVVMMDLDDFKQVNDRHGHLAGSFVLREIGALLRSKLRHFDVAGRYGGEEFIAYLPDTVIAEARTAGERMRQVVEQHVFEHHGRAITITLSAGISHFPEDGREHEQLVSAADARLYEAKRAGKNRVVGPD